MTPQRILLSGFLSYREEQEIFLDGAQLWMLAGSNGSGKSAVFDAVTYALFGGHRGGLSGAQALINKDSDRLHVEFDFLLDNALYRAERTLKLNSKGTGAGTQHLKRSRNGVWETEPDTTTRAGFDAWIREHLGFTYATFTSSVVLLQGKAEKLLSAAPRERFEVLAGIMDLDPYQRLHERVDERRRALQAELEVLRYQLAVLPEVTDADVARVQSQVEAAARALLDAQNRLSSLEHLEAAALQWTALCQELCRLEEQDQQTRTIVAQAAVIERDWQRLQALRGVLPALATGAQQRSRLLAARQEEQRLLELRGSLQTRLEQIRLAQEALEQHHRQRREAQSGCELSERAGMQQLQELSLALVSLRNLHRERQGLWAAQRVAREAENQRSRVQERIDVLGLNQARLAPRLQAASTLRQAADHRVTQARTLLQEARDQCERFFGAVGTKMCRYCGQALSPGHVATEQSRLERQRSQAEQAFQEACKQQRAAKAAEEELVGSARALEASRCDARQAADFEQQWQRQATQLAALHAERYLLSYQDVPDSFRERVTATPAREEQNVAYPSAKDLEDLQMARQRLEDRITAFQADRQRQESEEKKCQDEQRELAREWESLQTALNSDGRKLSLARAEQAAAEEIVTGLRALLPGEWAAALDDSDLDARARAWFSEKATLADSACEQRFRQLVEAKQQASALQARRDELERQRDLLPDEARRDPAGLGPLLDEAREERGRCEQQAAQAERERDRLEQARQQRQRLQAQSLETDRSYRRHALLAELLGRNRLQLQLVRRAERAVVDCANAVLDRLSGGQLYLRLRHEGEESGPDQALQLEAYNRATGSSPISVAFLSGSQRFRVAVSLALGIGQYASRQHRAIESVIIDEGFGCLDRQGRQVMIQELANLRNQLKCILLVSHQEEFADAFPDGYRFELVNGTTRASRFQR
jgi:DNA repair protein SbcC/Rad50